MHDLSGTDRRNPTVNGYGTLYGAPELSTDDFPILDPVTQRRDHVQRAGARREYADDARRSRGRALAVLGRRSDLGQQGERAQSDARSRGPRLVHGAHSRGRQSRVLQARFDRIRRRSGFRRSSAGRHLAVYEPDDEASTRSSTRASARIICSSRRTRTTRCGPAAAARWSVGSTRRSSMQPAMQRRRKVGRRYVLDTNGNGKLDAWMEPDQPRRCEARHAHRSGFYAVMPNPADGSVWGSVAFRYPGALAALRSEDAC